MPDIDIRRKHTRNLQEARAAIAAVAEETGLPSDDPVRFGPGTLLDAILALT